MKVVLDTNVLVAGFSTHGLCHSVVEVCLDRCEMFVGPRIIIETRKALQVKMKMPGDLVESILEFVQKNSSAVMASKVPRRICRDVNDLEILGIAEGAGAQYLVTGDKDLLQVKHYGETTIVTPRQFWGIVQGQSRGKLAPSNTCSDEDARCGGAAAPSLEGCAQEEVVLLLALIVVIPLPPSPVSLAP